MNFNQWELARQQAGGKPPSTKADLELMEAAFNAARSSPGDRLDDMFIAQEGFQVLLGNHFDAWDDEQRIAFIKDMVLALTDELHEALQETDWKPWAHGERTIRVPGYVKELIDAFHFLLNMMLVVGMTPNELTIEYFKKMEINVRRQKDKYDGRNKCAYCHRALDDIRPMLLIRDHGSVFDTFECRDKYNQENPAL